MSTTPTVSALLTWLREYGQRAVNSLLIDERRTIPPQIVLEFGRHGLFGLQIGREYGGLALSTCDTLAVMRQLGAIDLTLATLVSTHANGVYPVQQHGSAELKQQFLPQLASGRQLCGFGLTEVVAGSHPWAIEMSAHPLPAGRWRLHGRKIWVDSGSWASLLTLFAQTRDPASGLASISAFAVPLDTPGVHIEAEAPTMGLRGMVQNNIHLHYSVVQPEHVLGQPGQGMAIAQQALNVGRLMLAAKSIGATSHCLQLMTRYASVRQVATGRLLDNPVIRSWLGDLSARMLAAECLAWRIGQQIDAAASVPQELMFAVKNAAVETLWASADLALQTLGGRGYMENNVLPQILRDARTMRISEGPTEALNMALGAALVNAGEPVLAFMRAQLGASALADQLQQAIGPLVQRLGGPGSGFDARQNGLNWAYALLGQAATCGLLLAAVEHELSALDRAALDQSGPQAQGVQLPEPSPRPAQYQPPHQRSSLVAARHCLQARLAEHLRDLQQPGAAEVASLNLPELAPWLARIEATIGQPRQSAPGVDYALDPLLEPGPLQSGIDSVPQPPACRYWQQQAPYVPLHLLPDFARTSAAPQFATLKQPWPNWPATLQPALTRAGLHPDTLPLSAWLLVLQRHSGQASLSLGYAPASAAGQPIDILPISTTLPPLLPEALRQLDAQLAMARQMRHSPSLPGHGLLDQLSLLLVCDAAQAAALLPALATLPALEIMLCLEPFGVCWCYQQNLFAPASIERLHGQWQTALQSMQQALLADTGPATRLDQLPIMPPAEQQQLLNDFNQSALPINGPDKIHQYVEQQAQQRGTAIAAIFGNQRVSFAELNQQADHLARRLRQWGVRSNDFVGLCLPHSPDLLAGLLAILKTGAAYIPLDPDYPAARLQWVLEDSGMRHLLTCGAWENRLPAHQARVILIDEENPAQDGLAEELERIEGIEEIAASGTAAGGVAANPATAPTDSTRHTAYVLYTSGSTGQPKGVRVSHAALVNFIHAMQQALQLGAQDVVLAHTTLAFDIAGLEIFMPLCWGGTVLLPPPELRRDPAQLIGYLDQHRVTLLQATPALWQMLLLAGWRGNPQLVALCGGEALALDLARQLVGQCKRLWNVYGPTEATIWCAMQALDAAQLAEPDAQIPIGRPIANNRFYVLDAEQRLLPLGVPGELCVAGANLAQGYWQRDALEQEKFFIWHDGQRLYRTGDLVRWRADGVLLFMGRLDRQIKLRGYRIEPGEIEHWLRSHPAVQDAVVVSQRRSSMDAVLVAYLQTAQAPEPEALRAWLAPHLPPYMLPNHFVALTRLPLTANGKIDHLALPALAPAVLDSNGQPDPSNNAVLAPSTELQHRLRSLWADSLHLPPSGIGIDSHFFALGGHSLLAAQIVSRINNQLRLNLSLADFFTHPTIATLAQLLEPMSGSGAESGAESDAESGAESGSTATSSQPRLGQAAAAPPLPYPLANSAAMPVPLGNSQKALMFKLQTLFLAHQNVYNTSLCWLMQGTLDWPRLEQALHALHARHPALSTRFQLHDGQLANIRQICQPILPLPLTSKDLRQPPDASGQTPDQAQWQPLLAEFEQRLFDLQHGPMLRVQLLRLAHDQAILQIVLHHLVADGPAIAMLLAELSALYADPGAKLPLPPIQFADYLRWEVEHGRPAELNDYWLRYLSPLPPKFNYRQLQDAPGQAVSGPVAGFAVSVAAPTLAGIEQLAQRHHSTLFMLLMSAFALTLARHGDQTDLVIGHPMANRGVPGTDALLSCQFIVMPIRLHCPPDGTVAALLPQVQAHLGSNLQYGHADLAAIVQQLGVPVEPGGSHPIFQTVFLLEEKVAPAFDGIELRPRPGNPPCAKFDLLLYCQLSNRPDGGKQLDLYFQHRPAVLNRATTMAIAQDMNRLLDELAK